MNATQQDEVRTVLKEARSIVVKVGSRVLAKNPDLPEKLAEQFKALIQNGRSVVLVSSGATALGIARMGLTARPTELPLLQAAASAGQSALMRRYDEAFISQGLNCAQILLTHSDLASRKRLNCARHAIAALMDAGLVPIINENDVVSTEELRFGDNDQLAAMVAPLVSADALILLSDVPGVLDAEGQRIPILTDFSQFVDRGAGGENLGTGGMASKLNAAHKARRSGAQVVIGNACEPNGILKILNGEDYGTCILPVKDTLRARHHWIAYTLRPRGIVLLDQGAANVVAQGDSSVLPVGILGIRGDFRRGDSVKLVGPDGVEVARGLARLSALEVARAAGKKGEALASALGGSLENVVVHKDDLVLSD